jgi:Co/Zn/Cd efflux system component
LILILFLTSTYIKTGWAWGDVLLGGVIFIVILLAGLKLLRFSELNLILRKKGVQ